MAEGTTRSSPALDNPFLEAAVDSVVRNSPTGLGGPAEQVFSPPTYNEALQKPPTCGQDHPYLSSPCPHPSVNSTPLAVPRRDGDTASTQSSVAESEGTLLLRSRQPQYQTRDRLTRPATTERSHHERQQRGLARALLMWLGMGQWYSGVCIFVSFAFFAGGAVLVVLSVITVDALLQVKVTTIVAGFLFVLLSLLWPCTWVWNQCNKSCGCSYAPLVCYTWLLSLLYAAVVGALALAVNEHYECIHFCKNCTFESTDEYQCQYVQVSLWTLIGMVVLALVFALVSCVCCCLCSGKEERPRRYDTL